MNHPFQQFALFTAIFFCSLSNGHSDELFIAPDGDDQAAGRFDSPLATLQQAQSLVNPGDTVFIRGGVYKVKEQAIARKHRIWAYVNYLDKSGTREKPISYRAYQDERPIFDLSDVRPNNLRVTAFFVTASWVHFCGIEVIGVQVTIQGHTQSICFDNEGSHNVYERLVMHDGQAIGIYSVQGSNNLFLNCDAFNNYDHTSEGGKGGNVDGFGCHPPKGSTGNVFRGCRAWFNSDDGFDCICAHEPVIFENCWAFYNGYSSTFERRADGNGFKVGGYGSTPANRLPSTIPRHVTRFCLAVRNKSSGFYANHHLGGCDWFHNTAYRNGVNFNMLGRLPDNRTDVPGVGHKLRNNLAYKSRTPLVNLDLANSDSESNSFNSEIEITDTAFQSVDEAELIEPRTPQGNLPEIRFLQLSNPSPWIDAGTEIGLPFHGKRPDIGAFEHDLNKIPDASR